MKLCFRLTFCITIALLNLFPLHGYAGVSQGVDWLTTSHLEGGVVNADGSISSESGLSEPWQSTAEALITFKVLAQPANGVVGNGLAYLDGSHAEITEYLVLQQLANSASAVDDAALADIIHRQNEDGGVGAFPGFGSDPISTAFALQALSHAGIANDASEMMVSYLLQQQNSNGSWSVLDNPNRIETTALVVNAVWRYRHIYQTGDALESGVVWLAGQRDSSLLWPEIEASALALSAILNVETNRTPYLESFNRFADLQSSNGSFNDDVYLTALALRVLDAAAKPAPDDIVLSGRIVDGDTGAPLSGALIQLSGAASESYVSDASGEFQLNNLTAGNYQILVSLGGFGELTQNTFLAQGDRANLGDVQLSRIMMNPDTGEPLSIGVVRGAITDRASGEPLVGVSVAIAGTALATTTNASGEYQLTSVPAGSLQLSASLTGYRPASGSASLSSGQTLIFSPSLMQQEEPKGVSLQGQVSERDSGMALEGARVQITDASGQSQTLVTDANGHYSANELTAGTVSILTTLDGYHPVSVSTIAEDGANLDFSPKLDLLDQEPGVSVGGLNGTVIDEITGRGIADVQVLLTDASGQSLLASTNADGEFVFADLPPDSFTISLDAVDYQPVSVSVDIQADLITNLGEVTLRPSNTSLLANLSGSVLDVRSRQALEGAVISAREAATGSLTEVMSDTQGRFMLNVAAEGEYTITVSSTDYVSQTFSIVVSDSGELDLGEIRLRQPGVDALLADLAVAELDIGQLQSSQTDFSVSGAISGVIVNRGNIPVSVPLDVVAFEDVDRDGSFTAADTLLGSATLELDQGAGLAVDQSMAFSISLDGIQSFHGAPVTVLVDASNVLAELSETNNLSRTAGLCSNQQEGPSLDLSLCMDSSGSVSSSEFRLQLEGTALAIENESIVPRDGSVRISAIQFSSSSSVELSPTIIEQDNAEDIADAIRAIRKRGGGTSIHSCIDTANSLISAATPASALQVIDVSTDGYSSKSYAVAASERAMSAGIDVLNSIGVGSGVDRDLLDSIVFPQPSGGDRGFVITVSGYQEYIDGIATKIQRETRILDLTVGGLTLTDHGSGNPATASVTIGNGGSGDITNTVLIRIYDGLPAQGGQLLSEQTHTTGLQSGESAQVTIDGIIPDNMTSTELVVEVSLEGGSAECNLANNRQQVAVTSLLGEIGLSLDGSVFGSATDVGLMTAVSNTGALEGNYIADLRILDEAGIEVASLGSFEVNALIPGAVVNFSDVWNTGTVISGTYSAWARLSDRDGKVLDTATARFVISDLVNPDGTSNGALAAALRATTDRPFYHVDDRVELYALTENMTSIHPIANAELQMRVLDESGVEVFGETVALPSLVPGQVENTLRGLDLVQATEGVYQYQLTLLDDTGAVMMNAAASFEVLNDMNAAIRGAVSVQSAEIYQGDAQACTFVTSNTGTQDLQGLALGYQVLNVDTQVTVSEDAASEDLVAGGSTSRLETYFTADLAPGNYACVLEVTLDGSSRALAYEQFVILEAPDTIVADLQVAASAELLVFADALQETETPLQNAQREALEALLENRSYTLVDTVEAFETELLSGRYRQYLLLNEYQALDAFQSGLLREAVNRGDGLVFASGRAPVEASLSELLGHEPLATGCRGEATVADRPLTDFHIMDVGTVQMNQTIRGTGEDDYIRVSGAVRNAGSISGGEGDDVIHLSGWDDASNTSVTGDGGYNVLLLNEVVVSQHQPGGTNAGTVEFISGGRAVYNNFQEVRIIPAESDDGCVESAGDTTSVADSSGTIADRPLAEFNIMDVGTVQMNQTVQGTQADDYIKVSGAVRNAGSISGGDGDDVIHLFGWDDASNTSVTGDGGYNILVLNEQIVSRYEARGTGSGIVEFHSGGLAVYNNFQQVILGDVVGSCQGASSDAGAAIRANGVRLLESPVATAGDVLFGLERSLPRITLTRATLAGIFLNPELATSSDTGCSDDELADVPAVTLSDYGLGKAVFVGYDLLAEATQTGVEASVNPHADLLINSLDHTAPTTQNLHAGQSVAIELRLDNRGRANQLQARLLWPAGSYVLDNLPSAATQGEQVTWSLPLADNEQQTLTSRAIPEYSAASAEADAARIQAEIYLDGASTPVQAVELTLETPVTADLATIQHNLLALQGAESDPEILQQLEQAQASLQAAADQQAQGNLQAGISGLLHMTADLQAIDQDEVAALRLQVDELLWLWSQQLSHSTSQP
ncbi:carboxypeptidase regulatory-like domain-containing protein [Oceanobacter antarcticus]|uniref:Carboxypeptidase regulatory-like domain-containing protein n=1 Tax=Oceanobacter antarcticus TaxID=3133425 RepID=A0ABW8NLH5_9GAMM